MHVHQAPHFRSVDLPPPLAWSNAGAKVELAHFSIVRKEKGMVDMMDCASNTMGHKDQILRETCQKGSSDVLYLDMGPSTMIS